MGVAGKRRCSDMKSMAALFMILMVLVNLSLLIKGLDASSSSSSSSWSSDYHETDESLEARAEKLELFVDKLPSMPELRGYKHTHDGRFAPANLTIGMYEMRWKFHRDLPTSKVYAFGASSRQASVPGPSIVAIGSVETYIKWENHLPKDHMFRVDNTLEEANARGEGVPTVVHLHGSVSEPESDGNAQAWYTARFAGKGPMWTKEVYVYHNNPSTTNMWYHDHALGYTRLNLLAGLIGAYKVTNPSLDRALRLPSKKFDRQLVICDKSFTQNGHIYINSTGDNPSIHPEWQPEYFGDVVIVNGKAWPYLKVKRRKYRFRIINASNARFYQLALDNGLPFTQIGSDSFYLDRPRVMSSILLAPSEIADVVVDFALSLTDHTILTNSAPYPFPDGDLPNNATTANVMKFLINRTHISDRSHVPTHLVHVARLSDRHVAATRNIILYEYDSPTGDPTHLLINFRLFNDPITETPRKKTVEMWQIINLTPDNHPFHVHLAAFQVVGQHPIMDIDDLATCAVKMKGMDGCDLAKHLNNTVEAPPPNEAGWKNVFKMKPSYLTRILVQFSPLNSPDYPFDVTAAPGYAYHCHILDHEDNSMMRPYKIIS